MDEFYFSQAAFGGGRLAGKGRRVLREKGRTPYDGLRPWSAITHGVGALLAVLGMLLLLLRAGELRASVRQYGTLAVFGLALITLYTASTLYHCVNTSVKGRMALRRLDHASIYFLIAGTYTPICLLALNGVWGWSLFGVIWVLALAGVVLTLVWIQAPRWVTVGIYLFMGWLALVAIVPLSQALSQQGLFWLLLGGGAYTAGGILYVMKWPGRNNPRFGCHEVFHVCILLGSICHFLLMYQVILLMG